MKVLHALLVVAVLLKVPVAAHGIATLIAVLWCLKTIKAMWTLKTEIQQEERAKGLRP